MGPAFFVIAILGCGDGDAACRQVSVQPTHYSSLAACTQATDDAVAQATDVDFPVVVAQCRAAGMPIAAGPNAGEIKLPDAPDKSPIRRASAVRPVKPARA